ncbi:MAG: cyclopropane-fatty-acyl-phospholipid synthase, partial [Streptomyces sp.]|nr:cyclopropane-fatty-acyl-phospholipid synthase [Streptomyces sp.]
MPSPLNRPSLNGSSPNRPNLSDAALIEPPLNESTLDEPALDEPAPNGTPLNGSSHNGAPRTGTAPAGSAPAPSASAADWPSLVLPPPAPIRERMMRQLFRLAVRTLPIRVVFPGGGQAGRGGPDSPVLRVLDPAALYRRMGVCGPVGFGEAYMAGDWTSTDPAGVLTPFAARITRPVRKPFAVARQWADHARPACERNTIEGAQANVHRHYDLSNELFELFLDDTMTYSAAWFGPGDDLRAAQLRKIDAVLDDAGVGPGSRVLEIGGGWGSLAIRAAERGAEVTSLTVSREQEQLAA